MKNKFKKNNKFYPASPFVTPPNPRGASFGVPAIHLIKLVWRESPLVLTQLQYPLVFI
jgi:hypothetical protein